jgi:hypothetical protein
MPHEWGSWVSQGDTTFAVQFHSLPKRDLDQVVVQKKSLMPENFTEQLTVKELHDLFAYLMTLQ